MSQQFVSRNLPALLIGLALGGSVAVAQAQYSNDPTVSAITPQSTEAAKVSTASQTNESGTSQSQNMQLQSAIGSKPKGVVSLSQPDMRSTDRGPQGATFENLDTNYSN